MLSPADRLTFLQERQSGIGGSDVAAVLGLDEYRTPMDVYIDKTREVTEDDVLTPNIHMLRGQLLEDTAATLFTEDTGFKVRRMGQRQHPSYPFFMVNADRQILSSDDRGTGALECKAPAFRSFQKAIEEGARDEYVLQLQWALFVCGYDWGSMALCNLEHPAGPLVHWQVERSEPLIEHMQEKVYRFWMDHVRERRPPDPSEWRVERVEIEKLAGERVVVTSEHPANLYEQIVRVEKAVKAASEKQKLLKEALLKWLREHEVGKAEFPGLGKASVITKAGQRRLDAKQLERFGPLDPDRVDRYLAELGVAKALRDRVYDLKLDFDLFRTQGDDYEYVGIYPNKEGDA